jgi:hypothetical protein
VYSQERKKALKTFRKVTQKNKIKIIFNHFIGSSGGKNRKNNSNKF